MMRAEPPQRPRELGAGLFLQLPDDAVLDALAVLADASGQQPHTAAIPAHDDVLADEADHMNVGHQIVSREDRWRRLRRCPPTPSAAGRRATESGPPVGLASAGAPQKGSKGPVRHRGLMITIWPDVARALAGDAIARAWLSAGPY